MTVRGVQIRRNGAKASALWPLQDPKDNFAFNQSVQEGNLSRLV